MEFSHYLAYLASSSERFVIYFLLGGLVTVLVAYFAANGRGIISAFITTLPLLTILTILIIFAEGGTGMVEEYARSLLIFTPPWLCYVAIVWLGTGRIGVFKSLGLGVLAFVVLSFLFQKALTGAKL
ncbi:Uncharacterised protein [uncultured archaeon]|nr:Uncharacterised protein [uncultured archaeon]